jgi:hypothetical protein
VCAKGAAWGGAASNRPEAHNGCRQLCLRCRGPHGVMPSVTPSEVACVGACEGIEEKASALEHLQGGS